MENHESVVEAAARESKEEACANAETLYLHGIYNLKYIDQVYMLYRGALLDGQYAPGHETLETKLFKFDEIPWDDLAFVVIKHALELYLEDCKRMDFRIHEANLFKDGNGEIKFARYN